MTRLCQNDGPCHYKGQTNTGGLAVCNMKEGFCNSMAFASKVEKADINALKLAKELIDSVDMTCETHISREDLERMVESVVKVS